MPTTYNIEPDIAIKADRLTKIYRYRGLISSIFSRKYTREVSALTEFSLEVKKGEILGIIGNNGSGKSTLMKVLSGVTLPTSGTAVINGKLFAAIEVSGGFNPDFTGYKNLILTAKIWGFSNNSIKELLPVIIEFSDLKDFIHLPVKKYSTGMVSRLASSLIVHSDADIFLLDEVLNGSDLSFRRKLHKKIVEENKKGKTIIIASHTISDILTLCNRTIIIKKGKDIFNGNPFLALHLYRETVGNSSSELITGFEGHQENTFIEIKEFAVIKDENLLKFKMTLIPRQTLSSSITFILIINDSIDNPIAHTRFEITSLLDIQNLLCAIPRNIIGNGNHFVTIAAFSDPDFWMFIPRICSFSYADNNFDKKINFIPGVLISEAQWEKLE